MIDEATRQAYFEAARTIDSDFEMHRVYSTAIKRGVMPPPALAALLAASQKIDNDFEEATLLVEVAKLQPLDGTTGAILPPSRPSAPTSSTIGSSPRLPLALT